MTTQQHTHVYVQYIYRVQNEEKRKDMTRLNIRVLEFKSIDGDYICIYNTV